MLMATQEQKERQIVLSRRQFFGVMGAVVGALTADYLVRSQNASAQTPTLSPQPIICESPQPSPSEQLSLSSELPIHLTPEMQGRASEAFDQGYQVFKSLYLIDAGDGALRTQFDAEKQGSDTAFEYQSIAEIFAVYQGDFDTLDRFYRYDDRYRQPNGLTPWWIGSNGKVKDETVVSNVSMYMAYARLISPDEERKQDGREILQGLVDTSTINPDTDIPQAFHWPDSHNLTNPAFWSPYILERFAQVDPYWNQVSEATRKLMAKVDRKIEKGDWVYFPKWIDMEGHLTPKDEVPPPPVWGVVDYDASYVPLNQAMGALYCEDPVARVDARKQLSITNDFFYSKIAIRNSKGDVIDYNINRLLDGYDLFTGKKTPGQHWPLTAWSSSAAVASIVSEDQNYREYMFEMLMNMPLPSDHPFNDLMRNFSLLILSGKMEEVKN